MAFTGAATYGEVVVPGVGGKVLQCTVTSGGGGTLAKGATGIIASAGAGAGDFNMTAVLAGAPADGAWDAPALARVKVRAYINGAVDAKVSVAKLLQGGNNLGISVTNCDAAGDILLPIVVTAHYMG